MTDTTKNFVFIAGVYEGDTNIPLGVFESRHDASVLGQAVQSLRPDVCHYIRPIEVNKFDVDAAVALLDGVLADRDEYAD